MDKHQIHPGGERGASDVGGFQREVPLRVFSKQHPVRQGGGIPPVDQGREDRDRIC